MFSSQEGMASIQILPIDPVAISCARPRKHKWQEQLHVGIKICLALQRRMKSIVIQFLQCRLAVWVDHDCIRIVR